MVPTFVWRPAATLACWIFLGAALPSGCQTVASGPYEVKPAAELAMRVSGPRTPAETDTLVVLLHGAVSAGGPADYMYGLTGEIAAYRNHTTAAAIIRPGYYDAAGNRSPGNNYDRRDMTTPANNATITNEIRRLKAELGASRVIAMGHSAGASTLGAIIARAPGLVDTAILVSCPCNISKWRQRNGWRPYVRSESPSSLVDLVPASTRVVAITGSKDENTFSALGRDYVADLTKRGLDARFVQVGGAGHSFGGNLRSTAVQEIVNAIDSYRTAER